MTVRSSPVEAPVLPGLSPPGTCLELLPPQPERQPWIPLANAGDVQNKPPSATPARTKGDLSWPYTESFSKTQKGNIKKNLIKGTLQTLLFTWWKLPRKIKYRVYTGHSITYISLSLPLRNGDFFITESHGLVFKN